MRPKIRSATSALDHDDLRAGQLASGEESAAEQCAALDIHEMVVGTEHRERLGPGPLVLHPLEELDPHARVADLGNPREGLGVRRGEHGPDADLVGKPVGIQRGLGEEPHHVEHRRGRRSRWR